MIAIRFCDMALLLLVGLNSCIFAAETRISMTPDGSTFPLEGSRAVYTCIAVGSSTPPFAMFEDTSSNNITEGGHISIKRQTFNSNATTILTLTFNPIKISDGQTIQCKVKDEGRQVTIHVLPEASLPNVTLTPSGKLSVDKGSEVILTCSASTIIQSKITGIHIKWSFLGSKDLPDNTNEVKGNGTKNHKFSSLFISGVKEVNAGVYRCSAILTADGGDQTKPNKYFQDVEIEEVAFNDGAKDRSEEVESTAGGDVTFDCKVLGIPMPTIQWFKGDKKIMNGSDSRYVFSNKDTTNPLYRKLTIKDVTYSDRSIYKCEASRKRDNITMKFVLRVRDPLGALWPFIGIVVEAVILAIIILSYEFYKKQKKDKTDDVDAVFSEDFKETSPLVNKTSKVSYTAGEDGVRSRTGGNEVDA